MNEAKIWNYLKSKGLNDYAAAGVMGNIFAESGLNPRNLQNSYELSLGMSDDQYVAAVDSGSYKDFVHDKAGFGLCQWTYWSRKQNLLNFAQERGVSIADLTMQLDFMWKEMSAYRDVMATLYSATSVEQASNAVMLGYERPKNQSEGNQKRRAGYGQMFYDQFAGEEDLTLDEFTRLFQELRNQLQTNGAENWSASARHWAQESGLVVGSGVSADGTPNCMWRDLVTREQFAQIMFRLQQIIQ